MRDFKTHCDRVPVSFRDYGTAVGRRHRFVTVHNPVAVLLLCFWLVS